MMEAKIVLSHEKRFWTYSPGESVEGKLLISNSHPVHCCGIRIALESVVRVNFRDSEGILVTKVENVLNPPLFTYVWPRNWSYAQALGKGDTTTAFPASKHVFRFALTFPTFASCPLPGTFTGEYGSIKHQVVACIIFPKGYDPKAKSNTSSCTTAQVMVRETLNFQDYLNLVQVPTAQTPLILEKSKRSFITSLLSSSKGGGGGDSSSPLRFSLQMTQKGFLPGEYSPFKLIIINLTGKSVARVVVSLVQKASYVGDKSKKSLVSLLDEVETMEIDHAQETIWESGFSIPTHLESCDGRSAVVLRPSTFSKTCIIQFQYFIKVQIFRTSSLTPILKGHVPIIVGTIRKWENHKSSANCSRCCGCGHGSASATTSRNRRYSSDLPRLSSSSLRSSASGCSKSVENIPVSPPPPSYSQLSSRAASVDQFLPLYEDVTQGQDASKNESF